MFAIINGNAFHISINLNTKTSSQEINDPIFCISFWFCFRSTFSLKTHFDIRYFAWIGGSCLVEDNKSLPCNSSLRRNRCPHFTAHSKNIDCSSLTLTLTLTLTGCFYQSIQREKKSTDDLHFFFSTQIIYFIICHSLFLFSLPLMRYKIIHGQWLSTYFILLTTLLQKNCSVMI
jgi:hypothetical protein